MQPRSGWRVGRVNRRRNPTRFPVQGAWIECRITLSLIRPTNPEGAWWANSRRDRRSVSGRIRGEGATPTLRAIGSVGWARYTAIAWMGCKARTGSLGERWLCSSYVLSLIRSTHPATGLNGSSGLAARRNPTCSNRAVGGCRFTLAMKRPGVASAADFWRGSL